MFIMIAFKNSYQIVVMCIHSIMMEKFAQAVRVVCACHCIPFLYIIFTITYKVAVYAQAERADTLPLFHLYPYICTLWSAALITRLKLAHKLSLEEIDDW